MICEHCGELVRRPEMSLGGSWLYACSGCGKRTIRPAQQFRGAVTCSGITRTCIGATGTIDVNDQEIEP